VFLADDVLLFPFKGILAIFREVHKAALEEIAGEAEALRAELARVYQMLEQGVIDEADFDAAEQRILDRLDAIEDRDETFNVADDTDTEDEDADDDGDGDEEEDDEDDDESFEDEGHDYQYMPSTDEPWDGAGDGPAVR
jgi:Ran GTPase-activating protein (RanGAP) involved in mRNA processing and transport